MGDAGRSVICAGDTGAGEAPQDGSSSLELRRRGAPCLSPGRSPARSAGQAAARLHQRVYFSPSQIFVSTARTHHPCGRGAASFSLNREMTTVVELSMAVDLRMALGLSGLGRGRGELGVTVAWPSMSRLPWSWM